MEVSKSRVTAQGQISIPAKVRQKLGIGPGSVVLWEEHGDTFVVRRAGQFSSEEIHQAIFRGKAAKARNLDDFKAGIRKRMKKKYARD